MLIAFLTLGIYGKAQNATVLSRLAYTMKTYGVSKQKAEAYEGIREKLLSESESLKKKKITSKQFVDAQKQIYQKYGDEISITFYNGKDRKWSFCNQHLERYQMLCDNWLVPYETMRSLRAIEVEHEKNRIQIWSGDQQESKKIEKNEVLRNKEEQAIRALLGADAGDWYLEYKSLYLNTLKNMDIYKSSFHDAHAIATIESEFKKRRRLENKKLNVERELDLLKLEKEKDAAIISAVSSEVYARWHKVNSSLLDYNLNNKYGLTKSQIEQFKNAYSKFVIEEYKILNANKMGEIDKYALLNVLNDNFCKSVSTLFQPEQYEKWQGWWQYCFERKMKKIK